MIDSDGHALITGQTQSGKSTLARKLAAGALRRGFPIIVHDKFLNREWGQWGPNRKRVFVTRDDETFLRWVASSESAYVFLDEAPELVGRDKRGERFHWLATQGRHLGHRCHFIAQGPMQVHYAVRSNCIRLYTFRLYRSEAVKLYRDTGEPWNLRASELPRGHFFESAPFEPTVHRRVW